MIFTAIFWACFFILMGISIIVKAFFNINLPIVQSFIAIFFIYLGVTMMVPSKSRFTIFKEGQEDYPVVFSKQILDLSSIKPGKEVDTTIVFGKSILYINPNVPTKIKIKGAFSNISTPDQQHQETLMGKMFYATKNYDEDKKHVKIEAVAVFSNLKIVEKT